MYILNVANKSEARELIRKAAKKKLLILPHQWEDDFRVRREI